MKKLSEIYIIRTITMRCFFFVQLTTVLILQLGCKKFSTVPTPLSGIVNTDIYSTDKTAISAVNAAYVNLPILGLSQETSVYSDELSLWSGQIGANIQTALFSDALSAKSLNGTTTPLDFDAIYNHVYIVNAALAGVAASNTLTPAVKQQLLGETKFLRALDYFYLINLYGNVPLVLGTDYKTNTLLTNTAQNITYQQIIADLKSAVNQLSNNYLDGTLLSQTSDRVRPTKWAAYALLARIYLYNSKLDSAAAAASAVINQSAMFSLDSLSNVFLNTNNTEAIWQLQPTSNYVDTQDAIDFVIPPGIGISSATPYYLSNTLINAFEQNDQRKINWVGSYSDGSNTYYYPYKYKSVPVNGVVNLTEDETILRLAEMYLIRAEAEINSSPSAAVQDLNVIRQRAGVPPYSGATDEKSLSSAILRENQLEFFCELGHRFFDLKRTGNADAVMTAVAASKNASWATYKQLWPIPYNDVLYDRNLKQNPGY